MTALGTMALRYAALMGSFNDCMPVGILEG